MCSCVFLFLSVSDEHGCPSDGKTVGAVVGSNFTFTCFPPFGANDVLDASKDGGNEIFHYRKNKLTIQDEAYKDRIVKEPSEDKKKGFIIKLINVTKQDGGWYCCHYEYEGKRQKWINFTLGKNVKLYSTFGLYYYPPFCFYRNTENATMYITDFSVLQSRNDTLFQFKRHRFNVKNKKISRSQMNYRTVTSC